MFQRGAYCTGVLNSNILHALSNCPRKFERKRLGRIVNPLQLSKTLAVLNASCNCKYGQLAPLIPCKYSECFKGARTALICCTQTFICMQYHTFPANFTRKRLRRMANPLQLSRTLSVLIASCNCTYGQLVPTDSL